MTSRRRRERPSHNATRVRKPRRQGQLGEVIQDPPTDATASRRRRRSRQIADHIFIAFHQACDQRDLEVAERLLAVLAMAIASRWHQPAAVPDQRDKESLVAAYERFWHLRHPDIAGGTDEPV